MDTLAAYLDYENDPGYQQGQSQLVDLSRMTGIEPEYARLLALQTVKATKGDDISEPILMVFFAPTEIAQRMAQKSRAAWQDVAKVRVRIETTEQAVLARFDLAEPSLDALLRRATLEAHLGPVH